MTDAYGYTRPKYAHIMPGDFFEACNLHPCICTIGNEFDGDDSVMGISLVDGSETYCSALNCGVERLTFADALKRREKLRGVHANL